MSTDQSLKRGLLSLVSNSALSWTTRLCGWMPTRWNSTYEMLDRALLYVDAFELLAQIDPMYKALPIDDEWEKITRIHELLGPFCDITHMFFGSKYPTSNLYFENVWKIDMFLKEQLDYDDPIIRDMVIEKRAKFDKY